MQKAQEGVLERFHHYEQLASLSYGDAENEGEKS